MNSSLKNKLFFSLVASSILLLSACSKRYDDLPTFSALPIPDSLNNSVGRFKTSYLADQIHAYFRGNASGPIAVATFVDLDNLYGSSTFGRVLGEQLISELAMKGYNVIEVRQSDALQVMYDQGEFGLSREVQRLRRHQDVAGLVVGTYTVSPIRVYVNARIIDPASSMILSVGSVEMDKSAEITKLLRNNAVPASLERVPVRSLGYAAYPLPYYWPYPPTSRFGSKGMFDEGESFLPPLEPKMNNSGEQAPHSNLPPAPRLGPAT